MTPAPAAFPSLGAYLGLGGLLFLIGLFGALTRRNAVGILMAIELMFNGATVTFCAFNRFLHPHPLSGVMAALIVMTVAAAEAVVGLSLFLLMSRNRDTIYVEKFTLLKG